MGCAGSKPSTSSSSSKAKKPNDKKNGNSENGKQQNKQSPSKNSLNKDTDTTTEPTNKNPKNDDIHLDRNLNNFIIFHQPNIIKYIVNEVIENLKSNNKFNNTNTTHSSTTTPLTNGNDQNNNDVDDTSINKEAFINDVASRAMQLIKNSKCKTFTNLKQTLKKSPLPSIEDKDYICDLTVDTIHNCLNVIDENKFNNEFDLLTTIQIKKDSSSTVGGGGGDQQQQSPELTTTSLDNALTEQENLLKQQENLLINAEKHFNTRNLSLSEANEVARHLFLSNKARPVVRASKSIDNRYIVYKVDEDKELALTTNEIDDILNTKSNYQFNNISSSSNNNNLNNISSNNDVQLNSLNIDNELETLAKELYTEEGKLDNLLQQSLLDDRFYNNNSFKESYPLNNERIDDAAVKIQSSYRGHQTRSELANEKAEIKEEIKVEKKHEQIAEHKPSKDEVHHETRTESKSASVIVRSLIEPKNEENVQDNKKNVVDEPKSHLNDEKKDLNEAVTKIQSTFRGYKTRKDLEEKGVLHKLKHSDKHIITQNSSTPTTPQSQTPSSSIEVAHIIGESNNSSILNNESSNIEENSLHVDTPEQFNVSNDETSQHEIHSPDIDKAAIIIQSTFRGFHTRKDYHKLKSDHDEIHLDQHIDELSQKLTDFSNHNEILVEKDVQQKIEEPIILTTTEASFIKPEIETQQVENNLPIEEQVLTNEILNALECTANEIQQPSVDINNNEEPIVEEVVHTEETIVTQTPENLSHENTHIEELKACNVLIASVESQKENTEEKDACLTAIKSDVPVIEQEQHDEILDIIKTLADNSEKTQSESLLETNAQEETIITQAPENSSNENTHLKESNACTVLIASVEANREEIKDDVLVIEQEQHDDILDIIKTLADNSEQTQSELLLEPKIETNAQEEDIIQSILTNIQENTKEEHNKILDQEKNLDKAATKIQSTFRGYKTRKNLNINNSNTTISPNSDTNQKALTKNQKKNQKKKQQKLKEKLSNRASAEKSDETYTEERENVPIDSNKAENPDESKAAAATKIQATFRGYQTRKEMSGKLHDSK